MLEDAKQEYLIEYGERRYQQRETEIAALPRVMWKGTMLHSLTCHGDFGRGPHLMNVPESLLWHLIHFSRFRCAYHR